jgi:hypothetical protein
MRRGWQSSCPHLDMGDNYRSMRLTSFRLAMCERTPVHRRAARAAAICTLPATRYPAPDPALYVIQPCDASSGGDRLRLRRRQWTAYCHHPYSCTPNPMRSQAPISRYALLRVRMSRCDLTCSAEGPPSTDQVVSALKQGSSWSTHLAIT